MIKETFAILISVFMLYNTCISQEGVWTQTSFPSNNYVYFISAFENRIFAGSQNGLFMSADEGNTWSNLTDSFNISAVNSFIIFNN
ncbi:MAG TPA: hypothetical protein PKA70_20360, partial [Saprospiraceae bacterium]|nr:hypothetical protein [Saprospiraceae bacterium]